MPCRCGSAPTGQAIPARSHGENSVLSPSPAFSTCSSADRSWQPSVYLDTRPSHGLTWSGPSMTAGTKSPTTAGFMRIRRILTRQGNGATWNAVSRLSGRPAVCAPWATGHRPGTSANVRRISLRSSAFSTIRASWETTLRPTTCGPGTRLRPPSLMSFGTHLEIRRVAGRLGARRLSLL